MCLDVARYHDLMNVGEARYLLMEGLQTDSQGRLYPASEEDVEQQEVLIKLASISLEERYDEFLSGR